MSNERQADEQDFHTRNRRGIAKLRKKHPDYDEGELVRVLRETAALMERESRKRVIDAASFILSDRSGRR